MLVGWINFYFAFSLFLGSANYRHARNCSNSLLKYFVTRMDKCRYRKFATNRLTKRVPDIMHQTSFQRYCKTFGPGWRLSTSRKDANWPFLPFFDEIATQHSAAPVTSQKLRVLYQNSALAIYMLQIDKVSLAPRRSKGLPSYGWSLSPRPY